MNRKASQLEVYERNLNESRNGLNEKMKSTTNSDVFLSVFNLEQFVEKTVTLFSWLCMKKDTLEITKLSSWQF